MIWLILGTIGWPVAGFIGTIWAYRMTGVTSETARKYWGGFDTVGFLVLILLGPLTLASAIMYWAAEHILNFPFHRAIGRFISRFL